MKRAAFVAAACALVLTLPAWAAEETPEAYVGSAACGVCHPVPFLEWRGSHHQLAMQPASQASVQVDPSAATPTIAGRPASLSGAGDEAVIHSDGGEFPVRYVFGVSPLQQFLVDAGNGRLQGHALAWDSRSAGEGGQRWFDLTPDVASDDDVLHWSGPAQTWNFMCADCHSTAVTKGYDPVRRAYDTSFAEVSVGCEACHGPGAAHARSPYTSEIVREPTLEVCATCHSRREQLAEGYRPGADLFDHYLPSLLDDGLYFADGQIHDEVYVYGSFLQSRMHAAGVTCTDCHAPHSANLKRPGDATCTACHSETADTRYPQAAGRYASPDHHFHDDKTEGARCVSCHMPARTYMQIDARRDHRFGIPRPDLTRALGVPNACSGCHADKPVDWAIDILAERKAGRPRHWGEVFDASRRGKRGAASEVFALTRGTGMPPIVRGTALASLAALGGSARLGILREALQDPHPLVRIGALRGAAGFSSAQRWYLAGSMLDDPLLAVRVEAARLLLPMLDGVAGKEKARLDAVVGEYEQTQRLHADRAEGQTNLAILHLARGERDRAIAALIEALELNPVWVPAMVNLADLYRATGRDAEGGPLLERALPIAVDSPQVQLAYGLWLVRAGRPEAALAPLGAAARFAPGEASYAYVHAIALSSLGRAPEALAVIDRAVETIPDPQLLQAGLDIAQKSGDEAAARRYRAQLERANQN